MIEDLESLARLADKQSLVIGSGAGSRLVFPHPGVAPQHALLLRRGADLLVQDLDTVTGTFVNGREVRGLVELLPGDRLRLGTLELRIPQPAAPAGDATAVPPGMRGPSSALAVSFVEVDRTFKDRSKPGGMARALDAVSLDFEPGQFVGILGASGSGKSTLIKVLAGVVESSSGTILLDRREVDARLAARQEDRLSAARRDHPRDPDAHRRARSHRPPQGCRRDRRGSPQPGRRRPGASRPRGTRRQADPPVIRRPAEAHGPGRRAARRPQAHPARRGDLGPRPGDRGRHDGPVPLAGGRGADGRLHHPLHQPGPPLRPPALPDGRQMYLRRPRGRPETVLQGRGRRGRL